MVWAARRERTSGALVAVKVARRDDAGVAVRFAREAEALRLVGPPHVPALHAHGALADGRPYLVMERLGGETLAALLAARDAPLDAAEATAIGDAVLVALDAAHARGVVHRDLKAGGTMFVRGTPGHAPRLRPHAGRRGRRPRRDVRAGAVVGTSEYMAPEQIRGERSLDARADLYAFGVVLYELLDAAPAVRRRSRGRSSTGTSPSGRRARARSRRCPPRWRRSCWRASRRIRAAAPRSAAALRRLLAEAAHGAGPAGVARASSAS